MCYSGTILFSTLAYRGKGEVHLLFSTLVYKGKGDVYLEPYCSRPWRIKAREMSYFGTVLLSTFAYRGKGEVHLLFSTLVYKGKRDVLLWNHTILDLDV